MRCAASTPTDENNEFSEAVAYWLDEKELFRGVLGSTGVSGTPPETDLTELGGLRTKRRIASGVESFEVTLTASRPWQVLVQIELERDGRRGAIRTAFSSIYAPLDPNVASRNEEED